MKITIIDMHIDTNDKIKEIICFIVLFINKVFIGGYLKFPAAAQFYFVTFQNFNCIINKALSVESIALLCK